MDKANTLPHISARSSPEREAQVAPEDCCPRFEMRSGGFPLPGECWYCRYAYFGLERARPMKHGACRWPEAQID